VVGCHLRDKLSDSGLIGMLIARREANGLVVTEATVSCRALGRQLEDLMLAEAVRGIMAELPAGEVRFEFRTGPRNGPGREWLARFTDKPLGESGTVEVWNALQKVCAHDYPVGLETIHDEPRGH
jgi:predicted enzyme involved in methoxymalonyl-ACP biosynthesis